jgi:cyanophycin synthetase
MRTTPMRSAAMADLAARLDVRGRRIVVVAGPGDRRDEDIRAIAAAVAGRFDHYICRRDDSLRGRASDEVPNMLARVLRDAGVPEAAIEIIPDEQEAIARRSAWGAMAICCWCSPMR